MSRDYKLNKSELTRLRREEKLFSQYLPVLKLKQEQLQIEANRIRKEVLKITLEKDFAFEELDPFIKFFSDRTGIKIDHLTAIESVQTHKKNIAGVTINIMDSIKFKDVHLPYFQSAPWLMRALPILKNYLHFVAHLSLIDHEAAIIKRELRKATQKVNLFEMVLIPKTKDAIRRIKIALSDEQVASVSRGKIAKNKKLAEQFAAVLAKDLPLTAEGI